MCSTDLAAGQEPVDLLQVSNSDAISRRSVRGGKDKEDTERSTSVVQIASGICIGGWVPSTLALRTQATAAGLAQSSQFANLRDRPNSVWKASSHEMLST
mmetsp:Transcript_16050/g.66115  ORF Transcript_16050/g.66115 Transcript_16050/m.66115 type:complete len:100 (+) Transcript_16050:1312-1611(+)